MTASTRKKLNLVSSMLVGVGILLMAIGIVLVPAASPVLGDIGGGPLVNCIDREPGAHGAGCDPMTSGCTPATQWCIPVGNPVPTDCECTAQ